MSKTYDSVLNKLLNRLNNPVDKIKKSNFCIKNSTEYQQTDGKG
jgi:hypothetical protein